MTIKKATYKNALDDVAGRNIHAVLDIPLPINLKFMSHMCTNQSNEVKVHV